MDALILFNWDPLFYVAVRRMSFNKYIYLRIENAEGYVLIAVYLFISMRVTRITQKALNRIAWNSVGWLVIIRGPFD